MERRPVTPLPDRVQSPADLKALSDRAGKRVALSFGTDCPRF